MRITDLSMSDAVINSLQESRARYLQKQMQIANGKSYSRRSEKPADAASGARHELALDVASQWGKNIDYALTWTKVNDSRLNELVDRLHRVQEIGISGASDVLGTEVRQDLADEINATLEDLLLLGNSSFAGARLFGGTATAADPFVATRVGGSITAVTYQGNDEARSIQVNDGAVAAYGETGAGQDGLFVAADDGVDMFATLVQLRDELLTGDSPTDATLTDIAKSVDHAVRKMVGNGIRQQRYESLAKRSTTTKDEIRGRVSALQEVDMAHAITELAQLEAALQASMQMAVRMQGMRLMDFI